jgi:hypothetical protein
MDIEICAPKMCKLTTVMAARDALRTASAARKRKWDASVEGEDPRPKPLHHLGAKLLKKNVTAVQLVNL